MDDLDFVGFEQRAVAARDGFGERTYRWIIGVVLILDRLHSSVQLRWIGLLDLLLRWQSYKLCVGHRTVVVINVYNRGLHKVFSALRVHDARLDHEVLLSTVVSRVLSSPRRVKKFFNFSVVLQLLVFLWSLNRHG